jgi:phosphatidylserine/phosphatidylglycerophosphate/cardiolipin synthase-like enzyme
MVIDEETVITGSFNFTKAAEEKNAENLLVIRDKILAERYGQIVVRRTSKPGTDHNQYVYILRCSREEIGAT